MSVGPQGKKVHFWVGIRKLVNETDIGISNNYTGRHLAVQLSSPLAVWSVVPTFAEKSVGFFILVPPISSGFVE